MSDPELPVLPVPPLAPFLLELLDCVCDTIAEFGQGPVCWCGIYPGSSVSWEYCGNCSDDMCGMAYIRPGDASPYQIFPAAEIDASCAWPLVHAVEVGIVRCMPTMEEDGTLPDAQTVTDAALGMVLDQMALHRAIRCCVKDSVDAVGLGSWTPVGPAGNCHAGFWTIYVDPTNG